MKERNFLIEENQKIWDAYYISNLELWDLENKAKLESQQWKEEKEIQSKRLLGYNIPLEKITPYNCGYIRKSRVCNNISQLYYSLRGALKNHLIKLHQMI